MHCRLTSVVVGDHWSASMFLLIFAKWEIPPVQWATNLIIEKQVRPCKGRFIARASDGSLMQWRFTGRPLLLLPRCQIICGCHRNHFNSLRYVCSCIRIGLATKLKTERARIFEPQYGEHKIPWWYSISQKLRSGPPQKYLHIYLSLCCKLHGWYVHYCCFWQLVDMSLMAPNKSKSRLKRHGW